MSGNFVDFAGYSKAEVLRALHDSAKMYNDNPFYYRFGSIDLKYADDLLKTRDSVVYLNGRFLHVNFVTFPLLDSTEYDKYNGDNAMWNALELLKRHGALEN